MDQPPVHTDGGGERLARWLSLLDARFALETQHSSTDASWVFRGKDRRTGQTVALKLLKDWGGASRDAFVAEALLLAGLEHPGIVRYIAHGQLADEGAYLVTEWLQGEDLDSLLRRGPLSTAESLTIALRVANVLAAAHSRGIVHLDLKPSNLFLVGSDPADIRLLDFGIARLLRSASSDPDEFLVAGTPGYMAPEQILGEPLSAASDVFALGGVLFRCIAGRPIFQGEGMDVMSRTVSEPAPHVSEFAAGVHPALQALIDSMLDMDPAARPPDATQVLAAIGALPPEVLDGIGASARVLVNPRGLTTGERIPITAVLVRLRQDGSTDEDAEWSRRYEGTFERLAGGTWLALPRGNASALDQATHAARLALDIRSVWPESAIAIAAGRTVGGATTQLHDLLSQGDTLLRSASAGQILLDDGSAALIEDKFAFSRAAESAELLAGERAASPAGSAEGSVCLGRDRELALLTEIADDAFRAPRARVVLLTGPAGIGKSHVLREFLEQRDRKGHPIRVWSCYGDSMSAGTSLRLVSTLLQSASSTSDPALSLLVGNEQGKRAEPRGEHAGSVDEVHRAFCATVEGELELGPLLLRLEDIHWADLGSLRAIDYLLATLSDRPLLVVATARPDVHDLFPDLWLKRGLVDIPLGELDEQEADRLISLRLGKNVDPDVRARILQHARGNAFLLQELIRAQAEGRGEKTPETAIGVVQSRLRAFDPGARRVLRAASIFGQSFTVQALDRLLGEESNTSDVEQWLELLAARDVIRRRAEGPDGKGAFAFTHALVRDAAYDMLTDADRKLGHALAAQWLEAGAGRAAVAAQHYERAGDGTGAGRCYLRSTLEAFEIGDFAATLRSYERAVSFDLSGEDRGHALAIAAHAYRLVGDVEQARRLSAEALRMIPPNTPLWWQAARTAMMAGASKGRHRDS